MNVFSLKAQKMDLFTASSADTPQQLTRSSGLSMLKAFTPLAGGPYARERNVDKGRGQHLSVSCLSPYIRRRLISEAEILHAVQARHSFSASEKFISEIFWRTYFKGWLEMRPLIWSEWLAAAPSAQTDARFIQACSGQTDIACFNEWAAELRETGYLHNHARMWFASIWIFTLKLPWQWGAAFFMQWLRDGDPASNTLSWRWVAGLHSRGKHYLARADNIERFTNGRFAPYGNLDETALPISGAEPPPAIEPVWPELPPEKPYLLALHAEDCLAEELPLPGPPEAIMVLPGAMGNIPLGTGWLRDTSIDNLDSEALVDAGARAGAHFNCPVHTLSLADGAYPDAGAHTDITRQLCEYAQHYTVKDMIYSYTPTGPWQQNIAHITQLASKAGVQSHQLVRGYDRMCWPQARRGFFPFKEKIPGWLRDLPQA